MKRIRKYISLVIITISVNSLYAQSDTLIMTNADYRERVLSYSLDLKQADENIAQAEYGLRSIKGGMLPQVSAEVSFSHLMKEIELEIADFSVELKPYSYGAVLTAVQNIYSGGIVHKKGKVAEKSIEIAKSSRLLAIDNIKFGADYAYWSMTAISAYMDISEKYLSIVHETLMFVKERYESGLISKNDLLLIKTRVSEAELNYSLMQSRYKAALIGINIMMGENPDTPFLLSENVVVQNPMLPPLADILSVVDNSSEYIIANTQLLQSADEMRVTRSDYLPRVSVGVTGQYETELLNFDGSATLDAIVFAKLSLPIFSGNTKRHRISIDNSKIRSNEYNLNRVRDEIIKEVATSWSNLNESYSQLEISSNNYNSAKESLELSTYSFNQGLLSIIDLMQAQLSWLGAINGFVEANYNYHLSEAQYNKAINIL